MVQIQGWPYVQEASAGRIWPADRSLPTPVLIYIAEWNAINTF